MLERSKLIAEIWSKAELSYSRSSGPGGQNVNKVNTKVTLRLRLEDLSLLTAAELLKVQSALSHRLSGGTGNQAGEPRTHNSVNEVQGLAARNVVESAAATAGGAGLKALSGAATEHEGPASQGSAGGELVLQVQDERSQQRNREIAVLRVADLILAALKPVKTRRKTRPSKASKERRLLTKKQSSQRKIERKPPAPN